MKICMMSYTMSRQGFSPEEIVGATSDLGIKAIDWLTCCGYKPVDIQKMCNDAGIEIPCYTFFAEKLLAGEENWLDEIKYSIGDALTLKAKTIMIPTGVNASIVRSEFTSFWIEALKKVMPICKAMDITLTVENYPGKHSAFVTADDFITARNELPDLKLTFDNGNAASGENPVDSLLQCKDDIVHVHFKDWYIRNEYHEGYQQMLDGRFYKPALIGQGDIPTVECLEALEQIDYQGYINIEYESSDIPAKKAIAQAVNYLKSHSNKIE